MGCSCFTDSVDDVCAHGVTHINKYFDNSHVLLKFVFPTTFVRVNFGRLAELPVPDSFDAASSSYHVLAAPVGILNDILLVVLHHVLEELEIANVSKLDLANHDGWRAAADEARTML